MRENRAHHRRHQYQRSHDLLPIRSDLRLYGRNSHPSDLPLQLGESIDPPRNQNPPVPLRRPQIQSPPNLFDPPNLFPRQNSNSAIRRNSNSVLKHIHAKLPQRLPQPLRPALPSPQVLRQRPREEQQQRRNHPASRMIPRAENPRRTQPSGHRSRAQNDRRPGTETRPQPFGRLHQILNPLFAVKVDAHAADSSQPACAQSVTSNHEVVEKVGISS